MAVTDEGKLVMKGTKWSTKEELEDSVWEIT